MAVRPLGPVRVPCPAPIPPASGRRHRDVGLEGRAGHRVGRRLPRPGPALARRGRAGGAGARGRPAGPGARQHPARGRRRHRGPAGGRRRPGPAAERGRGRPARAGWRVVGGRRPPGRRPPVAGRRGRGLPLARARPGSPPSPASGSTAWPTGARWSPRRGPAPSASPAWGPARSPSGAARWSGWPSAAPGPPPGSSAPSCSRWEPERLVRLLALPAPAGRGDPGAGGRGDGCGQAVRRHRRRLPFGTSRPRIEQVTGDPPSQALSVRLTGLLEG